MPKISRFRLRRPKISRLRLLRFLDDISWFQLIASVLASVTAAFVASKLGVSGTLIGTALISLVITISSSLYANTLHGGRTLLVRTESGTVIERDVEAGEVADAFDDAEAEDGGDVVGAEFLDDDDAGAPESSPGRSGLRWSGLRWSGLHWKTIFATTAVVLAISLAIITGYELLTGHPIGQSDSDGGVSIIYQFRGGNEKPAGKPDSEESPSPNPTPASTAPSSPTTTEPTSTPSTPTSTPTPPTATTPAPTGPAPTGPTSSAGQAAGQQ